MTYAQEKNASAVPRRAPTADMKDAFSPLKIIASSLYLSALLLLLPMLVLMLVLTAACATSNSSNSNTGGGSGTPFAAPRFNVIDDVGELDGAISVTTAVVGTNTYLFAAGFADDGVSVFSVAPNTGSLTSVFHQTDVDSLQLFGVASVATGVVGAATYLFVAGNTDNGVSSFSVGTDGSLTFVFSQTDVGDTELDGASALTTAVVGGRTYLFAAGFADDGLSIFSVRADGSLGFESYVRDGDAAALELDGASALTTAVVGGRTYLFAAGHTDDGVSVFSVGANGRLTSVFNIDDASDSALELDGARSVTTAVVASTTYLFVAGEDDDGVSVFSVGANGSLTSVFNIDDASDSALEIEGAASVATAMVASTTYLFVAGSADNGVSVFSVGVNGSLTSVFNIDETADAGALELEGARSVATAVVGTTPYLFVAGNTDDGVSVFSVAPNTGNLTSVFNQTDAGVLELDDAASVATAVVGNTTYLFVTGSADDGVSVFSVAPNTGTMTSVFNIDDASDSALELDARSFC